MNPQRRSSNIRGETKRKNEGRELKINYVHEGETPHREEIVFCDLVVLNGESFYMDEEAVRKLERIL
ncbi:hypothetical protein AKJ43_01960 [candidate division MSBL1 archaeon SCGC-AAA261D19]|uniref:Uncharacterized protein n=1 Tax=candidate division MSBL1 archaeon SCGC-AAA261D19 TaxID=1698273 RepID=A0A133V7D6_9EURY|nr:hypothetical protein AKJ43_01960 [candidate division MSBL1 archaeon SCGC-AAA261D19]